MKQFNWRLLFAMCLLYVLALPITMPFGALASNITEADFYGIVTISNNGTNATNVHTVANISTQALIDGGYIDSDAENVVMQNTGGSDVAFMPGVSGNDWCMYVSSIAQDSYLSYLLYTGNVSGGDIRYFPNSGGMTISEDASLELGNNFTIEHSGYLNTTSNNTLIDKPSAFLTYINGANNITSAMLNTSWESPTGFNDPDANWVNETNAYDENVGTHTEHVNIASAWSSRLELTHSAIETSSVRIYAGYDPAGDATERIDVDAFYNGQWNDVYEGAPTHDAWVTYALATPNVLVTSVRARMEDQDAGNCWPRIYELDYGTDSSITATSITSGEYEITLQAIPNEPIWATGDVLHFDGSALSNINCGVLHNAATKLWMSFWFKLDANYSSANPSHQYLYGKAAGADFLYLRLDSTTGSIRFVSKAGAVERFNILSSETSWTAGVWYHVIASMSSANGVRLRIDNGAAVTDADVNPILNGGDFVIGSFWDGDPVGFEGIIANYIAGTDDLTVGEETDLYNGTAPADAVHYWYIDEASGTTIVDYGTGGDDGTRDANTAWATSTYTGGTTGRLCEFTLEMDSTNRWGRNLKGDSVPNTANNWTIGGDATPYIEYYKHTVAGVLQSQIEWEYDTTFTDLSGNGNDATPTFRTSSSDADVIGTMTNFLPVEEAEAPPYSLSDAPDFITTSPNLTGNFSTTINATFPGKEIIEAVSTAGATPAQLPMHLIFGFGIIALSLLLSWAMRRFGSSSLVVKSIIIVGLMGIAVGVGVYDLWMLVIFILIAIALAMASRHTSWA